MTKAELIEYLEEYDDDMEVCISYDYGDHWRTQVGEDIRRVEPATLFWSDYHRAWSVAEEDREYGLTKRKEAIILLK